MLKNLQPLVSIGLSVYNSEKYLRDCIDSILNQTFSNFELIIMNDGSKDGSDEIIKSYSDQRIRYYCFKENLGLAYRLNQMIDLSKGDYFARVDSDDILLNIRLEEQIKVLRNKDINFICHSSSILINIKGDEIGLQMAQNPISRNDILRGYYPIHPTVMARTLCYMENKYDI